MLTSSAGSATECPEGALVEIDDASGQRRLYGIKDPCYKSSNRYPGGCTDTATVSSLTNQTTAPATSNPSRTQAP